MKAGPILSILLGAAAVQAAPAAPPPAAAAGGVPKVPGVSDAGNALIGRSITARNQQLIPLVQQQNALSTQLNATVTAPTLDVGRFGTLLQQRRAVLGQIMAKQDDWMVGLLNQLSPADRQPFVRALTARANPNGAPPR